MKLETKIANIILDGYRQDIYYKEQAKEIMILVDKEMNKLREEIKRLNFENSCVAWNVMD
jgi:hypothetical protein